MRTYADVERQGVHIAIDEDHLDAFYRAYEARQRAALERPAPTRPDVRLEARLMTAVVVAVAAVAMWLVCNG